MNCPPVPEIRRLCRPVSATWLLALSLAWPLPGAAQTRSPAPPPVSPAATATPSGVSSAGTPNDNVNNGVASLQRGHYAIAMRAWRPDADKGNALAQNNIGYLYEHGLGVGQSYPEAMAWYRKAAAQNLPQAQFNIGTLYYYGYGVEKNPREAVGWFRQAARQGLAEAQYMLGLSYHEGTGVPAESSIALDWFVKSAQQGYVPAQLMSAMVYLGGDAGKEEPEKAYVWAEVAYQNGNLDASLVRDYASYKISRRQIENAKASARQCQKNPASACPPR